MKKIPKGKSRRTSPIKGPTYRSCPELKHRYHHTSLYEEGSELSKEIEKFKIDVKISDGFEVGYYPLVDQAGNSGSGICKYYDIENKPLSALHLNQLLYFCQWLSASIT